MDENIVFIKIKEDMKREINGFVVNPDIPLPVEKLAGSDNFDPEQLSWEMIISAMLKILAYDRDFEHAEYYRQFVKAVKPDLFNEMTKVGIYKASNRNFDIAEEIFMALEGLEPDDIPNILNLARCYEERAKYCRESGDECCEDKYNDLAYETYKRALDIDPMYPDTHFYAGAFFLGQSNYIKAREHLADYVSMGKDDDKKKAAQEVIDKLDSHDLADNLFKEAFDFIKMDMLDKGIARIKEFIADHDDIWNGWFVLGWGYRKAGKYADAKDAFLKAQENGGDSVELLNELAVCCMETNDYKYAEKCLKEALRKEPENSSIMINFGLLSMRKGDKDSAEGFFQSALEYDPDNRYARKYLDELKK
ncbi:MAG: tetratricopeptide repeat protein [Spirochaetia bacterium]|nr:tetratricopeptide repeat protein [Spirochaetia bacterium]